MAEQITAYIRKGCKTCARALDYLRERNVEFETVELFEADLTVEGLRELFAKIRKSPGELLRPRDRMYRELDLRNSLRSDEEILELMAEHPGLIKRPILVCGGRGVVAVKPEQADELLT